MGWFAERRRRRVLATARRDHLPFAQTAARLPVLSGLSDDELRRLLDLVVLFVDEKSFQGARGLEVTPAMATSIAAQACLPVLNLGIGAYDGWSDVIVYPDEFVPQREVRDEAGVVHVTRNPMVGEAWLGGPVILSWNEVESIRGDYPDGFNVVVHEFAHKLDMRSGDANGCPPLHRDMNRGDWARAFGAAYGDLCRRADQGRWCALDPYATESPAEFFAVAVEAFFEIPHRLKRCYAEVYEQLRRYFRQDPVLRRTDY